MPIVTQFSLLLENRPGVLAAVCSELAAKAVNIEAIMTSDVRGWGTVRLVVNRAETTRKVLDSLGIKYSEEDVFSVKLSDRPGALGRITRKLAEDKVNIEYVYGSIEKGSPKAILIFGFSDMKRAAKLIK